LNLPKIQKKKNRKKKSKVNLILLYNESHIFILDPQIGPQAFRHTHCTLGKSVFFNMKKGPTQGSICFKLVQGFWSLDPCLKWPLLMVFSMFPMLAHVSGPDHARRSPNTVLVSHESWIFWEHSDIGSSSRRMFRREPI